VPDISRSKKSWHFLIKLPDNFQRYIIFSINLVSQVTLTSSWTDILYGCYLLRCLYNILYFLWLYNEFFNTCICSSLDGIWTHTIDILQHQSLSLMSSSLDHSTTSAPCKCSFNSRSVTLFQFIIVCICVPSTHA
jgi:hypothetical protein